MGLKHSVLCIQSKVLLLPLPPIHQQVMPTQALNMKAWIYFFACPLLPP